MILKNSGMTGRVSLSLGAEPPVCVVGALVRIVFSWRRLTGRASESESQASLQVLRGRFGEIQIEGTSIFRG